MNRSLAHRGRLLLAVLLAMATAGLWTSDATAGPESDIPGIPLPGPSATGRLGGPIYDVVYRFQTLAGFVVVVSLTGTTGTDFDLYLFDETATTVTSDQGLLARSTGPTSTERLSYPIRQGGTYYINLNGASDVEGTYTLNVQVVPDQTPPTATLTLNDGRSLTNGVAVPVELIGYDSLSGIAEMSFSTDGSTFGAWQPYARTSTWTFEPGDGPRTLWARVRDGAGNASQPASASVTIDSVPPTIVSVSPARDATVTTTEPVFTVRFGEAIDVLSWGAKGLILQAPDGSRVGGVSSTDPTRQVGYFVPSYPLQPGVSYVVTVGPVTDLAGNALAPVGSWSNTVRVTTSLALAANPAVVALGKGTTVSGTAANLNGVAVTIEAREASSPSYGRIGEVTPQNGKFSILALPRMNSWYRAAFAGGPGQEASTSNEVRVLVRRGVALLGYSTGTTARTRAGRAVVLVAQVTPVAAGVPVTFRLYRLDTRTGRSVLVTTRSARSTSAGQVRTTWTPTSSGAYYWRVLAGPTPEYANNTSPPYRWTVTR
jgi:hypothetical protein